MYYEKLTKEIKDKVLCRGRTLNISVAKVYDLSVAKYAAVLGNAEKSFTSLAKIVSILKDSKNIDGRLVNEIMEAEKVISEIRGIK